jgi:hypothetical protein
LVGIGFRRKKRERKRVAIIFSPQRRRGLAEIRREKLCEPLRHLCVSAVKFFFSQSKIIIPV